MVNDVTAPKNMILTSKQHAKYLFASWNTQQASYPKRRAAVLYISSMGLMYWLDWLLGQENQFYSIGVFWVYIWWWCSVCCCIMGWRDRFYNIGGICCVVVCQFCEFVVGWSVWWFGLVSLSNHHHTTTTTTDHHHSWPIPHPKYSYAIKPVLPSQQSIRPIHKPHTGNV